MKTGRNKRAIIVSIFICIALAILIVFVLTLGGQKKTFVRKIPVKVIFKDIEGLKEGNNVWFSGVKVGTVRSIDLKDNSVVEVTLTIEEKSEGFIHKDALVKLSNEGLLGNKLVVIYGGTKAAPIIQPNDYLHVQNTSVSTEDMFSTLQQNNKNLLDITDNFKTVSHKIASGEGSIGRLVNDEELVNHLQATLIDLQTTVSNFKAASVKSQHVLANLENFSAKLNQQGSSINELLADTTIYTSLRGSLAQLRNAVNNANEFTQNVKAATSNLNDNNSAIGVLLRDEEVAAQLKSTMRNLETSSQKLDEDLEAVQHNFLLRGFFKKKAKNEKNEKNEKK